MEIKSEVSPIVVGGIDTHKNLHVAAVVDMAGARWRPSPSPRPGRAIAPWCGGCAASATSASSAWRGRAATGRASRGTRWTLASRSSRSRSEVGVAGAEIEPELYDGLGHGRELGPNTPAKPSPSGADPRPARRLALSLHMPPPTIQQAVGRSTRGKFSWPAVVLD
jgi:hypothetical protein